jgi:tetratricopeptide (TPR) repeat protein
MSRFRDHRSTLQVIGVYAAGGWLAYEIIDEIGLRAGLPEWVSTVALLLLILGLPVVTLTAWVQNAAARATPTLHSDGRDVDPTLHPEFAGLSPTHSRLAGLLTWRRTAATGVLLFVLLGFGATGFMTARATGFGPFGTLFAQGVLSANDPILMADFASERDPALGRAVGEALRIDLVQSNVIRMADTRLVQEALERMGRDPADGLPPDVARAVAEREGLKAYIRGEVGVLGGGYQRHAELVAADGAVLDAFRETARDSTQLIDAIDRMSNRMRARIGESLRTIRGSQPLSRVTTASVPALRRYSEGQQLSRQTGDMVRAAELYQQAVALDSTFGMAWLGLGISLGNMGVRRDDMLAAFRRAWSLREQMPERERWRAVASYESYITDDQHAAADAYRRLLALEPDNMPARNNLAVTLRRLHRDAEAEALLLPVPPAERSGTEWLNLVHAQYDQGRFDAARASMAEMKRHQGGHVNALSLETTLAAADGAFDRADSILVAGQAPFAGNVSAGLVVAGTRAMLAALQGRIAEGLRLMEDGANVAGRVGLADLQLAAQLQSAAGVAFILEDGARALRMLDATFARHDRSALPPQSRGHIITAMIYAAAGDVQRARAELAEYERVVPAEDRRAGQPEVDVVNATIAMRSGDPAAAVPLLRRAMEHGDCRICGLAELGQAYELLGQPDSARVAYHGYLDTPFLGRLGNDVVWRATVLFRLGQIYEQAGERDRALQYYGEFLEQWRRADPELQPRVEAVRRRVAALRSAG